MNPDSIASHFPSEIEMPAELRQLCAWLGSNGYPISGYFELRADDYLAIKYWFGTDRVLHRFGVFGAGSDGSLYALWLQNDGRTPVVHLGSEGQNNVVLAESFVDFLRLLAVGYGELGFDDLSQPPDSDGVNPNFQNWVRETFHVSLPSKGIAITASAHSSCEDFQGWIDEVLDGGAG